MISDNFYDIPIDPLEFSLAITRLRELMHKTDGYSMHQEIQDYLKVFIDNLIDSCIDNEQQKKDEKLRDFIERMAISFILLGHECGMVKMETGFLSSMKSPSTMDC